MPQLTVGGTWLTLEQRNALEATAASIATPGKGITACDESAGTIGARMAKVGIENTEENRRKYRQMLFEAPGANAFLSGAILDPETLYQKSNTNGKTFPQVLTERGIVPGVKPHLKAYTLPGTNDDTVMQGLDSLASRCKEYYKAGARFAKWRSPIVIDVKAGRPTDLAIKANMHDLARYALICQSEGLMPIVEPDVSLSGTHTLEEAIDVNIRVQSELFKAMVDHGVFMAGSILKPNIVNPGRDCPKSYTLMEIAEANIFVLKQSFPVAMKGANYLSGGQTLDEAAARLNVINRIKGNCPWNLSFSWSQALQLPLLQLCAGKGELDVPAMTTLYIKELKIASAAALGQLELKLGKGDHERKRERDEEQPIDTSRPRVL
jgi:fructose-bisphosphate aldolase class I